MQVDEHARGGEGWARTTPASRGQTSGHSPRLSTDRGSRKDCKRTSGAGSPGVRCQEPLKASPWNRHASGTGIRAKMRQLLAIWLVLAHVPACSSSWDSSVTFHSPLPDVPVSGRTLSISLEVKSAANIPPWRWRAHAHIQTYASTHPQIQPRPALGRFKKNTERPGVPERQTQQFRPTLDPQNQSAGLPLIPDARKGKGDSLPGRDQAV
jgi:hypothetical protein